MRAVDTNVVLCLVALDDARQVAAAEAFIQKGAWVSVLVLAETAWVLTSTFGLDSTQLATAIEMLLNHRDLVFQDAETISQALRLFRSNPKLGFADCLILQLAHKAGNLPLGTFDKNLAKTAGAHRL